MENEKNSIIFRVRINSLTCQHDDNPDSPPGDPANKVTGYPVEKMYNLPLSGYYGSFIRPDIRVHLNPFKGSPNIRFFYFGSVII